MVLQRLRRQDNRRAGHLAIGAQKCGRIGRHAATPRAFLESLFRTAVAAAHPAALPAAACCRSRRKGRLIVLAAGKAAGSMAEVAEQHLSRRG